MRKTLFVLILTIVLCLGTVLLTACIPIEEIDSMVAFEKKTIIGKWRRVNGDGFWIKPENDYYAIEYDFWPDNNLAIYIYGENYKLIERYDIDVHYDQNGHSINDDVEYVIDGDKLTLTYRDGTYETFEDTHSD